MKGSEPQKSTVKDKTKISKSLTKTSKATNQKIKAQQAAQQSQKIQINCITKQNFDVMHQKTNVTLIKPLQVKYILKCIDGLFKNRFLYITTHKQGQIIGGGDAKKNNLTLQIQGVGLSDRHCKLKFNGLKKFSVKDYSSTSGTWLKIPSDGILIKNNDIFILDKWNIKFEQAQQIQQIQQICNLYNKNQLCDLLLYNKINNIPELYRANYQKFKSYPFSNQEINELKSICEQSKQWFNQALDYKLLNMYYLNQQAIGYSQQIGWKTKFICKQLTNTLKNQKIDVIAEIQKGRLISKGGRIFSKISAQKNYSIGLHDQIKIGDLVFQLNRFNFGAGQNIGGRQSMEDCIICQQDVGGSQWKLISFFAVLDGYGGPQCMLYIKQNILNKIKQWTPILDDAGDLNQMVKVLMCKTFYQLDYEFYQKYSSISDSCGTTILAMLIIDSKAYVFNLGDNKGFIYRQDVMYKLSIDQIPGRVDQKTRIEEAGGFVQYNRLNGKCTLSRAFGQFQYKNQADYKNNMKGKLKSCLSCIPEVVCFDIVPSKDQFILLSTDGIFDALNLKTITNYILQRSANLQKQEYPDKIVSSLIENCKITNPQVDNMALVLIFIRKGKIGGNISF